MKGDEIISQCKETNHSLPTFLFSGCVQDIEDKNFKDLGKISFIPKPINWRRFCRQLQQAIDQQRDK
jgi:FixJ family two-component response regulator